MEVAFNNIKKALCNYVLVITLDFSKPFILQTDASDMAFVLWAILCQEREGTEIPVAFANNKLNVTEQS